MGLDEMRVLRLFGTLSAIFVSVPILVAQTIQITAPADRSIVQPGETIAVKIVTFPDRAFSVVAVMGPGGLTAESEIRGQFNVPIPSGVCCGTREITAVGRATGKEEPVYSSVSIDIERRDLPVQLQSESASRFHFNSPGDIPLPFLFRAIFRDGSSFDARESSYITYSSANPAVARVNAGGEVHPLLPGRTAVSAKYSLNGKSVQLTVPVVIDVGPIAASTYLLSFANQPVGSAVQESIVLRNTTRGPVKILKVTTNGRFSESDDCANSHPLQPGGTCVVKVNFAASKTGFEEGLLTIVNDFSTGQLGILLEGTGH